MITLWEVFMIVIGFSRARNFKSWLIQAVTGGRWSHTWIGYTDREWGGQWVAHAIDKGVTIQRAELIKEHYDESECFQVLGGVDIDQGMRETRDYINRPYDFKAVMWNGLLLLLYRLTGVEWFNPIVEHNKVSCSEFVGLVLQRSNFKPVQGREAELFSHDGKVGLYPIIARNTDSMKKINFDPWISM